MRQLVELQTVLRQLIAEHRQLLAQLDRQHAVMVKMDLNAMRLLLVQEETTRQRITALDLKRKAIGKQIAVAIKYTGEPTLTRLAELFPPQAPGLLAIRDELRQVIGKITQRTSSSARVTSAVLGHLNTAMRILAGAVNRAGLYTRQGTPRIGSRLGVMDAVG